MTTPMPKEMTENTAQRARPTAPVISSVSPGGCWLAVVLIARLPLPLVLPSAKTVTSVAAVMSRARMAATCAEHMADWQSWLTTQPHTAQLLESLR